MHLNQDFYVVVGKQCRTENAMIQKGTTFDNDFYVVVAKQCRTENALTGHQHNIFI